jgi:type I site-specific restriction endonuclease
MDEAATRKQLIDKQLEAAGWNISDYNQVIAEPEYKITLPDGKHYTTVTTRPTHRFSRAFQHTREHKTLFACLV